MLEKTIHSQQNVISQALNWLEEGNSVWLTTVTKTWGSSPMPAGNLMAYCAEKGMAGSLSGGCIEQDLLEKMEGGTLISTGEPALPIFLVYGATEAEQKKFLLPCGGQLHLMLELLKPISSTTQHLRHIKTALENRHSIGRKVCYQSGELSLISDWTERGIKQQEDSLIQGFGPDYQMLLIGASEVSRCVAELALMLDFRVSVWDHREEFIKNWSVRQVKIYSGSPEKLISSQFNDANNAIIALAHDPRVDDLALVDALSTQAFYVGAIGSKKTCENRNNRLLNYLDDPELLKKMHAPVGLSIGSKTPAEIAISILAEVIQEKTLLEKSLLKKDNK